MAAAFNTVPEEEPLVEKAATKTPRRRLVGGAAVVSFALGLVAATALSSAAPGTSPAGAQTALKSHKKLGSTASASYIVNIACLDKDNNVLWNSKDSSNEYQWAANSYLLPDDAKWSSWDSTDFDYVETSEYVLKHEWAQKCHGFSIAVQGPDGYDAAPTFRVYEGDGNYVAFSDDDGAGYFKAGDNIDSDDLHPVVQNLKGNLDGASEPWALKNSVFLHDPDGVVQGNRYLLVDIKFEPKKHTYAKGAHRCVIDADVTSDGWEIKKGGISGCDISPPAYSCDVDNLIMYYTGSLRNLNDGAPIDIEFKNFATLDMPLNNIEIVYDLNQGQQECVDMCDWANGGAWKASNDECWMNVALQTIGNKGLGPVTIWGNGQITTSFLEGQSIPDGRGIVTSYPEDQGLQAKAVRVQNEWSVQASALVITQDVEYPSFKDVGYALNVQGISFGNLWPRQDATVVHQACYYSSLWDDCLGLAEKHGALLKNINLVAWWWQSDAPNLSAMNSKIDTSFFVATDDAMHVSASGLYAWRNVLISGSAGNAINLDSYNDGINWRKIEDVTIDGVFIPRAARMGKFNSQGNTDTAMGIIGTLTCMTSGPLELKNVVVKNLVVAGLGPDENGEQLQQIDRLFSITSYGGNGPSCGDDGQDWKDLPAPKFDVTLQDFYLSGNGYAAPSEECNNVHNGKGDWKIKLVGDELKDSFDKNNPCPDHGN